MDEDQVDQSTEDNQESEDTGSRESERAKRESSVFSTIGGARQVNISRFVENRTNPLMERIARLEINLATSNKNIQAVNSSTERSLIQINTSIVALQQSLKVISDGMDVSDKLEKIRDANDRARERQLAEQSLRDGKEQVVERKMQSALSAPLRKIGAKARSILGDQGDKLTAVCMHSKVYYDLVERKMVDYVLASDGNGGSATASGGSITGAYTAGNDTVPTYCGLRVIVSDDVSTAGSGSSTEYSTYFFTAGAVASGEQAGLTTETDRDILAKSDAMAIDLHYTYHPVGSKWAVTTTNPNRTQLATVGNWSKVYETKNIGIVRATNVSTQD